MPADREKKLYQKIRLEFNYNSNHLEGNTLTYGETELLLIFDDTKGNHTLREYEEMKAHDVAYQLIAEWAKEKDWPLTEHNIKELNHIILVRPFWKDAIAPDRSKTRRLIKVGDYKEYPNSVMLSNGEMFEYASPIDTPILMGELINWYKQNEGKVHPVELAATFHYKFVCIHPFDDGNGRVARLLMNYILLKNGLPPIVVKTDDKLTYLRMLNRADSGDIKPLIEYLAEQEIWSLELYIKAAKGESIEDEEDWKKQLKVFKSELSKNEEIKAVKNAEVLAELVENNLFPFIDKLFCEINEYFSDLFLKIALKFFGSNPTRFGFTNTQSAVELYRKNAHLFAEGLNFEFRFNTFKKNGKNSFDCNFDIKVNFANLSYTMQFEELQISKVYKSFINEKDFKEIFNHLGANLLSVIQNKVAS